MKYYVGEEGEPKLQHNIYIFLISTKLVMREIMTQTVGRTVGQVNSRITFI